VNHQSRRNPWPLAALVAAAALALTVAIASPRAAFAAAAPAPVAAPSSGGLGGEQVPPKVREAVDRALDWLAKNQIKDGDRKGSWAQGGGSTTAVPSLAVMAFLARGHTPGQGPYGDVINEAIDYTLASQKPTGIFARETNNATMYEHGISTVMLSEAYGMVDETRRDKIDRALPKAVKVILDAQKKPDGSPKDMPHRGGWRYGPTVADADISVSGWQMMALRGAANCGAAVPKSALDEGVEYIRRCASKGGGFGYQPDGGPNQARTGTGTLTMALLGNIAKKEGQEHAPEAIAGGEYLLKNPPTDPGSTEFYFYAVYYCSQALNQLGGKYYEVAYPKLRDALLAHQQENGAWKGGSNQEAEAGEAYRTSMAVLALSVPFRYLPLYQK
jgi:prenyltransferase beta subunit